jgi:hypothetical protein
MQTSYPTEPAAGKLGQLADSGQHDIVSRVSAAKIPFGRFVSYSAANGVVKLPAAATDILNSTSYAVSEGIALENPSKECVAANTLGVAAANAASYDIGDEISVLKRGRCFVYVEQAVGPADTVYVRYTANGNNVVGNFRKDDDTSKAASLGEKAHFVGTTSGAGIVEIDIRL